MAVAKKTNKKSAEATSAKKGRRGVPGGRETAAVVAAPVVEAATPTASAKAGRPVSSQAARRAAKIENGKTAAGPAKASSSGRSPRGSRKPVSYDPVALPTSRDLESEIRERAFQIFEQRGPQGDALSDWLQAEAEVRQRHGAAP